MLSRFKLLNGQQSGKMRYNPLRTGLILRVGIFTHDTLITHCDIYEPAQRIYIVINILHLCASHETVMTEQ